MGVVEVRSTFSNLRQALKGYCIWYSIAYCSCYCKS